MPVGRYAGKRIDTLPLSYLRWMLTQDFPKELLQHAKKKVGASAFDGLDLHVSRHAIDMFSLRFMHLWNASVRTPEGKDIGIATFVARMADKAYREGKDTSLHRHQNDGYRRDYGGIRWVFALNHDFPEYKEVVTVMPTDG